jgi:hypothetical protein
VSHFIFQPQNGYFAIFMKKIGLKCVLFSEHIPYEGHFIPSIVIHAPTSSSIPIVHRGKPIGFLAALG